MNLVAELERRLVGDSPSIGLDPDLRSRIPYTRSTVLVLFDGLGSHQLKHPRGAELASARVADLDAPFPSTTTVSLATIATALPPSQHGLIAYQLWNPDVGHVVNTIHMTTMWGAAIDQDHGSFLPSPNLWERLTAARVGVVAIQPANFDRTPLTRALYRGASFSGYDSLDDAVRLTIESADRGAGFVFLYVPHIDFAAHLAGQRSEQYDIAIAAANDLWVRLAAELPESVSLVGTSDHGHVDIADSAKIRLTKEQEADLTLYGDARSMFIRGDGASLASDIGGTWVPFDQLDELWGPRPFHRSFNDRQPDGILFADPGTAIFHSRSNDRLIGHHGGLTPGERLIPLLVRTS